MPVVGGSLHGLDVESVAVGVADVVIPAVATVPVSFSPALGVDDGPAIGAYRGHIGAARPGDPIRLPFDVSKVFVIEDDED